MANYTKQEVKELVRLFVSQQGNQTGLDGMDEILDVIIDVAWSGTPGPPPELDYCVQVDRAQSFTDAQKQQGRDNLGIEYVDTSKCLKLDRIQPFTNSEKAQGVYNLGPQQILDAIKELAGTLKNKIIDADDNTIKDITGKEVKNGFLVGEIPASWKFYAWMRETYPTLYTKSVADNPAVDIYEQRDGKMTIVGTASISADVLVRDTISYTRDTSKDGYKVDESNIKFAGVDLAIQLLNMIDALEASFKEVSTFEGVTGKDGVLYYLNTKYGDYKKGLYVYNGSAYVWIDPKQVFYVSTFTGVDGDPDVLYYLDTKYDSYTKGFYRFIPAAGTEPAKFKLIGSTGVFTDVDELPSTNISKDTIYRMLVDKYYEDGVVLTSVPTGYVSNRPAIVIIDANGITDDGTLYPWADLDDDQMDSFLIRNQIVEVPAADLMTVSTCFKTAANHYVYKDHVTNDQVYELYHNPTETANAFVKIEGGGSNITLDNVTTEEVNGKVQANAIIDVDVFPTTGIKEATFYRKREDHFIDANDNEVVAVAKYICDGNHLEAIAVGLVDKSTGIPTPWAALTDEIIDGYVASGYCRVAEAIGDTPYTLYFIKTGTDAYAHLMCVKTKSLYHHEDGAWKLVSEDSASDGVTIETVNNKLQANAIIEVQSLPSTGYKQNSLYRMLDTATQTFKRYYYNGSADPLPETPTFYKGDGEHLVFGADGYTLNGGRGSYSSISEITLSVWMNNGWVSETTDFSEAGMFRMPGSLAVYDSTTKLTEEDYVVTAEMDKVFKRVQGGWECITHIQLTKEQYDILSEAQKNDGTLYIVNDEEE